MTPNKAARAWLVAVLATAGLALVWPLDSARIDDAPPDGPERLAALQAPVAAPTAPLLVEIARAAPEDAAGALLRLVALAEAQAAAPGDLEIADALAQARLAYPEALPPRPEASPPLGLLTADGWGAIAFGLWSATSWLVLAASRRSAVAVGFLLAATTTGLWLQTTRQDPRGRIGVVRTPDAGLRALPDLTEPPQTTVPVGSEVVVLNLGVDFARIQTGDGQEGWLPSDAIQRATAP
jgi:hypothetical protein